MRDNTIESIRDRVLEALNTGADAPVKFEAQDLMHLLEEYDDAKDEVAELERELADRDEEVQEIYALLDDADHDTTPKYRN